MHSDFTSKSILENMGHLYNLYWLAVASRATQL